MFPLEEGTTAVCPADVRLRAHELSIFPAIAIANAIAIAIANAIAIAIANAIAIAVCTRQVGVFAVWGRTLVGTRKGK